jgi:4-nitrophenyl phosphatase
MTPSQTSSAAGALVGLRGFAFDLDGTIWEGSRLLPGASALVADLRQAGIGVVFASNNSRHASGVICRQLEHLGILADPKEVVAAFDLVGEEIRRRLGPVRVLPIGTDELAEILASCGHEILRDDEGKGAQAVVVGIDPDFSYDRLRSAARAVAAGAAFFAINLDARFPVGPGEFDPGCGALAAAIAMAGGAHPVTIGKPELPLFQAAIQRLECLPHQAAMVGDSTSSDIEGGRAAGMFTIWVDSEHDRPTPASVDLRVPDLDELRRLWRDAVGPGGICTGPD